MTSRRCFPPRPTRRCVLVVSVILGFLFLVIIHYSIIARKTLKPLALRFNPAHKKKVHEHVHRVLADQCRPNSVRKRDLQGKVDDLLKLLPDTPPPGKTDKCQRCVVMGNGGILRGLELGSLIDRFDTVIRLNSGPLGKFTVDVGNRTSIRLSYPEGSPQQWTDTDPDTLFAGVVYKSVDITWMSAMILKRTVPLWDWLFFWQNVPNQIPLGPQKFKLLNPRVIRETAFDLLKYPPPRPRMWGWDQNLPTLGMSALNLASLLCDEVSLAGFGYNLSQKEAPLHYYDQLSMSEMWHQKMHNVDLETKLLHSLVREGRAGTKKKKPGGRRRKLRPTGLLSASNCQNTPTYNMHY
ncbi:hypothetical protein Q5P01_009368 [Channa striata]|uniref:Lactosylceramide alpha-2,3-sialyltransferase n=1 Tax=Channa striata TaxID=64152 RepID=A0AA88N6N7_CHASR|nr:hypothetical protein Q5P01_009368 [Channa striata]